MNKRIMTACLTALFVFTGCIVVESPGDRPVSGDRATISEINAAGRLTFDDAKARTLGDIASRPYLSAAAQVHLAKTAARSLVFDDSKQQVLLKLVNNPYFVAEGKQAVLDNLNKLVFDSSREAILQAISRRGSLPSERELLQQQQSLIPAASETPAIETQLTIETEAASGRNL